MEQAGLQGSIEAALQALGYELVELEWATGGLLRVTIDYPWREDAAQQPQIGIDDCERATRQLQYLFEVEDLDYQRLEVSSPGVDRPLRTPQDFRRFAGETIDVVLKAPLGQAVSGRRKYRGRLVAGDDEGRWQLLPSASGRRVRAAGSAGSVELDFALDELQSARLVPVLDFKGRSGRPGAHEDGRD